jgi:hypothetical protein
LNLIAAKFTKWKSLEMQGGFHGEKRKALKGNFNRTEGSRHRNRRSLRNWQLMVRVPEALL